MVCFESSCEREKGKDMVQNKGKERLDCSVSLTLYGLATC